jgi:hypothetical protein
MTMTMASAGAIQGPVASRVALDLLYCWVMRSAPKNLIRMAIKMAREAGQLFLSSIL